MRNILTCAFISMSGLALSMPAGLAQDSTNEQAVEPAATEALDKMGAFLRTLKQFKLTATTTKDEVVEGGQLVETAGRVIYQVRRPDRLKLDVATDNSERVFFYDGKTVTQFAPALGYYSVFEAGPTIAETLDLAYQRYDVEMPVADLFYWGTDRSNVKHLAAAFAAGESRIAGETCSHYAYRAEVADFQVWIRKYGDPLPCRMVIVTTDDDARPRYSANFEWDMDPLIGDTVFTFAPPPGAEKIEQVEIIGGDEAEEIEQ